MHTRRGTADTATQLAAVFGPRAFTTREAESAGVSRRRVGQAIQAGHLILLRRGVYAVRGQVSKQDEARVVLQHLVEACRERGIPAVVGGECAAALWGLPFADLGLPTIVVPRSSRMHLGTRSGVRVLKQNLAPEHLQECDGLPVTSPLVTGLLLARGRAHHQVVGVLGLAQRRTAESLLAGNSRMDAADLTAALAHASLREQLAGQLAGCLPDSPRLRRCASVADPRPETYLEGISWGRFSGWRLGPTEPQAWVLGASGRHYRSDFLIDGVVGEADGSIKYRDPDALWKEKLRQEDIERGGYPVVRWTFVDAEHRPQVLLARWRRALGR